MATDEGERLIGELEAARAQMRTLLGRIDVQREIYPGWRIKHVLAHIAGWDDAVNASLRAHLGGEEPGTPAARGIDFYNAQSVATREFLDYEQVVQEWELARDELETILNEMPAEKFQEPLLFPWGRRGTVAQLVAVFVEHEAEHAAEIAKLAPGRAGG